MELSPSQLPELAAFCKAQLLDDCTPFWLEQSLDRQFGGYITKLERDGTPYGTDKYIWTPAREA